MLMMLSPGLLREMLRSTKTGDYKSSFACPKVLIMDKLTLKIMSHSCKMVDITDEGVSCKDQKK
jgi:syntaxin-binding protein 1